MRAGLFSELVVIRNYDVAGIDARNNQVREIVRVLLGVPAKVDVAGTTEDQSPARDQAVEGYFVFLPLDHAGEAVWVNAEDELERADGTILKADGAAERLDLIRGPSHLELKAKAVEG